MIVVGKEIYSTEGKMVHKIGTDFYFKRAIAKSTDVVEMYEEVDEMPKYTYKEYSDKVDELVREKYSISQELAILRQRDEKVAEYEEYYRYAEECKVRAKEILNNKEDEEVVE